ncbi:MAG: ECF-type sigma factor [Pirellulaceae bacterium]
MNGLLYGAMSDVTQVLCRIEHGDLAATDELLPLVYDELRRLAARKMAAENPGQTLQATALVHEAYVRLVDVRQAQHWESRGHFFAAAAEAMRRILVERARKKLRRDAIEKMRSPLEALTRLSAFADVDLLALDEAIGALAQANQRAADLVKLRFFAGLSLPEVADSMGISSRTAERLWTYARTWLHRALADAPHPQSDDGTIS